MKHRKGCTFGWDGSCVVGCPYHRESEGPHRLARVREASGVESGFVEKAKDRRWQALKFVSPGLRGVPDRMVLKGTKRIHELLYIATMRHWSDDQVRELIASVIEFAELKAPGKDATLEQLRLHAKFDELGFHVDVIDTSAKVESWYADRS